MKNLLFKSKYAALAILLTVLSCEKEECPITTPPEDNKLVIEVNVDKQYWAESGASGEVNGKNKEYGKAEYAIGLNGIYGLSFVQSVWYENTSWAARESIDIINIDLMSVGDTIELKRQEITSTEPLIRLFHLYLDGDAGAECYEIDDEAESPSWLLINEYSPENKVVAGELHLSLAISDECPPKYDPNAPDYITIRNFHFRAKMRE